MVREYLYSSSLWNEARNSIGNGQIINLIFDIVKLYTLNSFFTNGPDLLTSESKQMMRKYWSWFKEQ